MRRALLACVVLLLSVMGLFVPSAQAITVASRTLTVTGDGVAMFPAFDPAIDRYAVTTTSLTGGTLDVTATTADPNGLVQVDGRSTTSPTTTVSGLTAGDEVSVIITDNAGATAYSLVYLPAGFPAMSATGSGPVQPGYLGVGLTTFGAGPSFQALLDRNGVPAWVQQGVGNDLKRQPNGELTMMPPTTAVGHTGSDLLTLDDQFRAGARRHVVGDLTDTDNHDSQRLADGSTILIGYEPRGDCNTGYLDATIQKVDAAGTVTFQWNSQGLEAESLNQMLWPQSGPCQRIDYAHINSVEEIPDGSGDLLVSFRHLSAVYRVATVAHGVYAAGDIVWRLGGRHSDFTFVNDPDTGPCAQHDATWLGANHVLLFDNGSATVGGSQAACVNPADTSGPGISRGHTRVSEYEIDPVAHTATLAWSYAPASTFTFFAGSAARLGNGDTLIGWASDRTTLATEVDNASTPAPVWSLSIPGNTQNSGYTSYRVSLVGYTDAIPPVVTASGADGAAYVAGDSVLAPSYSCTDRGGSNLQTCSATGATGGLLDTSTVGDHTWQVSARDGAGNTTLVTRHYTVRLPGRHPDGLIRKGGTTIWHGGNISPGSSGETVRQGVRRTHRTTDYWRVQNDGERADGFRLIASRTTRKFAVHYVVGGIDVTPAVVAGTYRTPALEPGQSITVKVTVRPTRRARPGTARTVTMAAAAVTDPTKIDRVAAVVTARR